MDKATREARLRAVRRMQDNVYDDIGTPSDMRPDVGDDDEDDSPRDRAMAQARSLGRDLAEPGARQLRDAYDSDGRSRVAKRKRKSGY